MIKILVLHGLGSGANNGTAQVIKNELDGVDVYAPEIPFNPLEAFEEVKRFEKEYQPDIIVGTSMGGFYTMSIDTKAFKILINPAMDIENDIKDGIIKDNVSLVQKFTKVRSNGETEYVLDNDFLEKLNSIKSKFDNQTFVYDDKNKIKGLFGVEDELFHHAYDYIKKYNRDCTMIPTHHHLEKEDVRRYVVPEIEDVIEAM